MPIDVDNAKGELVIDPYRSKERYKSWDKRIPGISPEHERLIVAYLEDMRRGVNVAPNARKGKRSYRRLITQRDRLKRTMELLEKHENVRHLPAAEAHEFFDLERALGNLFEKMEDGDIPNRHGRKFLSVGDHISSFKAFWHWYMTYMKREKSVSIPDVTAYLSVKRDRKPEFVFLGEPGRVEVQEGFRKLFDHARYEYRPLMAFLFDSGVRAPTELVNIKGKDISPIPNKPYFFLQIRDETAKTFGRRIKLMFCHEILRSYLAEKEIGPEDFVFPISPSVVNQYLKRLGQRVLGKKGLTMYDFRHNSVCYFLPRYKSENALMYRYGWKNSQMIHYYSELLGMKDTLEDDDLLIDVSKTQLEKELDQERKQRLHMTEELSLLRNRMGKISDFMNKLTQDPETVRVLSKRIRDSGIREIPI